MNVALENGATDAPALFFQNAVETFARAREQSPHYSEVYFTFAGHTVRLCIAGALMSERVTRAFGHLAAPPSAADLTVLVWDDVSTGTQMPPAPWDWRGARLEHGTIAGFNTERFFTTYEAIADVLELFDQATQTAVYWTRDARRLKGNEYAAPMRTILHWFLQAQGHVVLHSGAVGSAEGGVLLAGKGGAGKSTTALACLGADLKFVADDYCVVSPGTPPRVHSLYRSAKLREDSLARLVQFASAAAPRALWDGDKAVLFLDGVWSAKVTGGFPVVAILLPRAHGGTDTFLKPATAKEGIQALALSTLAQSPRVSQLTIERIQALVRGLPCYWLELGTETAQIPRRVEEVIARHQVQMRESAPL